MPKKTWTLIDLQRNPLEDTFAGPLVLDAGELGVPNCRVEMRTLGAAVCATALIS